MQRHIITRIAKVLTNTSRGNTRRASLSTISPQQDDIWINLTMMLLKMLRRRCINSRRRIHNMTYILSLQCIYLQSHHQANAQQPSTLPSLHPSISSQPSVLPSFVPSYKPSYTKQPSHSPSISSVPSIEVRIYCSVHD